MEQEIKRLRELVGELSLELRFKDELLKKTGFDTECLASNCVLKDQVRITKGLTWSGVNPSDFYYKLNSGKPG